MADEKNPWLSIPLADYEAHMSSAAVGQLQALSDLFAAALAFTNPESVAILGIAGGNGLERLHVNRVRRVVGIDINNSFLDETRKRFSHLSGLELHCANLADELPAIAPVDLVHAALVFEHAGLAGPLQNAARLVAAGGALSVVLQLPSTSAAAVGLSGVTSVENAASHFQFIDPGALRSGVESRGFTLMHQTTLPVPAGKAFWHAIFTSTQGSAPIETAATSD